MAETPIRWTSARALAGAVAIAAALSATIGTPHAQTGARAIHITATSVNAAADWDRQIDGLRGAGALRLSVSRPDLLMPGRTHERLDQYFNGVRIFGAQTVRQVGADGRAVSVFGTVHTQLALDTTPALSADQAIARAVAITGGTLLPARAPELVILPLADGQYALAWWLRLRTRADFLSLFVDAQTGAELQRSSDIRRDARVGVGTGVLGDQKKLSVDSRAGAFFAQDELRPPTIITYDLKGNLDRVERLLDGIIAPGQADIAQDTDNVWTDGANVDAQAHLGYTYDYYFKRFNRQGLDNHDGPIVAITHPVSRTDIFRYLSDDDVIGLFYANAFWCGGCGQDGRGMMVFGEGLPVGLFTVDVNFFSGALDVVGHELTHGVTEYTSGLIAGNEPGALNEAFSDMMGASVEAFIQPAGNGPLKSDWTMGEDIYPREPGFIRSLANPGEFGDPDHYSRRYLGAADEGGVHTNSTIPSHAFYLAIEGGTNRTSGRSVTGVGAGNREQIEKVFYRGFTQLLPPDATFSVARQATLQAAVDLYGASSAAFRAVSQAWDAVGVF
jgi:thermolysin